MGRPDTGGEPAALMKEKVHFHKNWRLLLTVLMLGLLIQNVMWFAPASLLPVMQEEMGISLAGGGLVMSIVCLVAALAGPFSGLCARRFGIGKSFAVSMALAAAGSLGTAMTSGFAGVLACRVVFGVGIGLSLSLGAAAIVAYAPQKARPYLNSFYAILPYLASAVNFLVTVKLFTAVGGNWRATLAVPGIAAVAALLLWAAVRRKPGAEKYASAPQAANAPRRYGAALRRVCSMREVRLICLADACDMWGFEFLSSFLPTFLYESGGRTLAEASVLTSIFPVTGIAAGLAFGLLMSKSGRRKIFTWPFHLMILAGTLMIAFGTSAVQVAGIVLAGIGNAGWAPALYTMPMEFAGVAESDVAVIFSVMLPLGYLAAFLSPIVGGAIAGAIGLQATFAVFSVAALAAAGLTFAMKETGRAAAGHGAAVADTR